MKRLLIGVLAVAALALVAPQKSEAQVRVSVHFGSGPRWGYGYRTYRPASYHYHGYYGRSYHRYHYAGRVPVVHVRPYRPRPIVVVRGRYHRGYRHW